MVIIYTFFQRIDGFVGGLASASASASPIPSKILNSPDGRGSDAIAEIKASISSSKTADSVIDFGYMKQFMKDVLIAYGVTPDRAETCSEVLIEADRRGIDSHCLGRLKPIYCDRMDQGILWPDKPITVLKETDTTALVDGNLGLGLYIGPHCMQMAIDKSKKHGVGFVAVKNSTHYGIAGYYVTMATQAGLGRMHVPRLLPRGGSNQC
jgi:hypothetical protein